MKTRFIVLAIASAMFSISCSSTGTTGPVGQILNIPGKIINGATNPIPGLSNLKIPNLPLPF